VRADLRLLAGLTLGLIVFSSLPYLYGYLASPADRQFMGLVYGVHDYAQYMSWARESGDRLLVENKLTAEQGPPAFFNLYWWLIGRAGRLSGLDFLAVNQAGRLISILLYVVAAGAFCAAIFDEPLRRRFALLLACLSAGFGWGLVALKPLLGELPLPLLVHNSLGNTFFSAMVVPHHLFAAAVLAGLFLLVLRGYQRDSIWRLALAGLLALVLGLAHTYDLVLAYPVVALFGLLVTLRDGPRARWLIGVGLFYALSVPAPLYWALVSASRPDWREVLAQYRNLGVFTPDPLQLIVLLGPALPLALLTYRGLVPLAQRSVADLLLYSWFGLTLLLIYLPLNFQIMLLNGSQLVLAVLATRGLFDHLLPWIRSGAEQARWPGAASLRPALLGSARLLPVLLLVLMLPTNLYLLAWRCFDLGRGAYPYFLAHDDLAALGWLEQQVEPDDVVLSSLEVGHFVPGRTGAHAFLAHGANTLDFNRKRSLVERFYTTEMSDPERRQLLARYGVSYIFYGPAERRLGRFQPEQAEYLQPAFVRPATAVYRVS
jgi:hypothetical protein